ncbi:hypothetical protein MKX01_002436 [Papaver californicum]|nr:hypothetical protein MKX01_002436 [Papaver californicum]
MREVNSTKPTKFADQNQNPTRGGGGGVNNPVLKSTTNASKLKSASSWGSQIVKGFSADKKTKTATTTTTIPARRLPLSTSTNRNNTTTLPPAYQSRAKRSILGEFTCSAHPSQVYPADSSSNRPSSTKGSHDLFLELDHLRTLLKESKERELNLQSELSEHKKNPKVSHLEKELESKRIETDNLVKKVGLLETESKSLIEQLVSLSSIVENHVQASKKQENVSSKCNLEMEVVELRRLNKELQLQKRNLSCRLSTAETRLAALENVSESEVLAKVKAEASTLRDTNEDLCKQVEGLQMNRLTEVEELVYLRWVNSCLRNELQNSGSNLDSENQNSVEDGENVAVSSGSSSKDLFEFSSGKKLHLMKRLKKWPKIGEDLSNFKFPHLTLDKDCSDSQEGGRSPRRRHSISGSKLFVDEFVQNKRRQSDGFTTCAKEAGNEEELGGGQSPRFFENSQEISRMTAALDVERRTLRIPNPPPRPSCSISSSVVKECSTSKLMPPPPPPPPPPPKLLSMRSNTNAVQRVPQVVEFYHSLMKRESRKDSSGGGVCEAHDVSNARSSMIDEIENRSSHLLAIKADVETQGEFVNSLIREVNGAVYQDIEDVVAFVKWLDDELCFLVDERAVLKHFEWPEKKADTLREAAFGYRDLKKLESEVSSYVDDPRLPCDTALKKMVALSEKMERSVHSLSRTRDGLMRHCKDFQIPTDWMLDTGIISKIKFGSVKLAKKYMKRVAMELLTKRASEKDPALEYMLLQGVRFAFRIHQFAGGFDAETMHAFEELRNLAMSEIQK